MKLFGWGKSKDPQPQGRQQVSKADPRSGSHGLDRCTSLQSGMGSIMPGKGSMRSRQQQGLFDSTNPELADSEEKLQDKIRFVFSHEREGLLAIGTFALEQLQSIRNTIDGHQRGSGGGAAASSNAADPAVLGDHEYEFGGSEGVNLLALDNEEDVMQSSDDEDQLQRSWLAARQTCDLPVFGDTGSEEPDAVESDSEHAPFVRPATLAVQQPWHDDSKALTLYKGKPAETTPVFILAPELRSALQRPFLPHWTDSVPPSVIAKVEPAAGPFVDDDYYSTRLCGLFNKKTKSLKSKRMAIVPAAGEDASKRTIPIEKAAHHEVTKRSTSSSLLKFDASMPSLGKLAKLWWATLTPSSTARIAPERKPSPPQPAFKVPPCNPKSAEGRRRVQAHERMMDNNGHWIKDDEDCEFATFLFNMSR